VKETIVTSRVGNTERAFSLLELILVLLVLGLSALIVLPNIDKGMRDRDVRRSALGLAAAARDLRGQALLKGIPQQLILRTADNVYFAGSNNEVHLPSTVKFAAIEGGDSVESGAHQFWFFPNGSALPGQIDLSGADDLIQYSVRLHPLTGKVEVLRSGKS
jgi:prepilin-type N-terminal cleavage/methylation domain-containing protein